MLNSGVSPSFWSLAMFKYFMTELKKKCGIVSLRGEVKTVQTKVCTFYFIENARTPASKRL
jgi:hypothetical protein